MSSTAPTFVFPHPTLTKIIGQPSNTSITLLTREIYTNAHTTPFHCFAVVGPTATLVW